MTTLEVNAPSTFTLPNARSFIDQILSASSKGNVVLNFEHVGWFPPGTMLFVASEIARIKGSNNQGTIDLINHEKQTYVANMGFFRACGFDFGLDPGEAPGSSRYIPITKVETASWHYENRKNTISEYVDDRMRAAAHVLCQDCDDNVKRIIHFSLREIARNVFEHAQAQYLFFMGQYWPTTNRAEIAIADDGIGIAETIKRNPYIPISSETESLRVAVLPGISGSNRPRVGDEWDNSGFGLYMVSQVAKRFGRFAIFSGQSALSIREQGISEFIYPKAGTMVILSFQMERIKNTQSLLSQIAVEGEQEAKQLTGNSAIRSSKSSHSTY
jgi:hypothetical protein